MDSGSFTHAAPSHVDTSTEWDDAQARLGNVKPKPKPAKPEKFTASFDDAGALASRRNDAVDASTSDGDDFDDDDDDAYVREYRARRMKELTAEATAKAQAKEAALSLENVRNANVFPNGDFEGGPPFALSPKIVADLLIPVGFEAVSLTETPETQWARGRQEYLYRFRRT